MEINILKIKEKFSSKKPFGYVKWYNVDPNWYLKMHEKSYLLHRNFIEYLQDKPNIKTVLEIGCGTGVYPINKKELFKDKNYTGVDFSEPNIEYCKKNSEFEFISGDFLKMNFSTTYDLVFSHAVVDHVGDIDKFIRKILKITKKYAYISSYRGHFPELKKHKINWDNDFGCYFNDLSIKQARRVLLKSGIEDDEFIIRKQESGHDDSPLANHTVIEIKKKN